MKNKKELLKRISELEEKLPNEYDALELLEAAFNYAEVGFTLSDANGVVLKINPAQVIITDHEPEMTIGRSMTVIENENNNKSATMQVIQTKQPVTIEQVLPSGKSYLVFGQPYFDASGELKYVICNLIDNTQHNYTRQELESEKSTNIKLNQTVKHLQSLVDMQKSLVFCSKGMQELIDLCDKIAPFNSTVLICGESGVGKELVADYIFQKSTRANKPFIKINCAAIPENLLESELFGYEAGAFTSASSKGKKGIFEIADGGTVLLDEVGELPFHLQSKILRVLQEGEFYHVGGTEPIHTDVRIIAATNSNLEDMIDQKLFRKDLFYRLSVIQIAVPSLKERKEDIPHLIRHFLSNFNDKYKLDKEFTFEAIEYLKELQYEGNVRDLQNRIERIILLSHNNIIGLSEVTINQGKNSSEDENLYSNATYDHELSLKSIVSRFEKELLQSYWQKHKCASKIAEELKTTQPTISRKLHSYDII